MSSKVKMQRVAESVWMVVLSEHDEYFTKPWDVFLLKKLKTARFTKQGGLKMDAVGKMVAHEFTTLYNIWKERMNDKNST